MRISDWSSDVCSSDLHLRGRTVAILRRLGRTHSRRLPAPRRPARRIAGASRGRPLRRRRAAVPPLVPARRPRSGLISNERISTMTDTNELTITRYIDAAPETVWDVMVNRQEEWWCPKPWRAEFDVNARRPGGRHEVRHAGTDGEVHRSEEHTSELQSLMRNSYAVFCLKKK